MPLSLSPTTPLSQAQRSSVNRLPNELLVEIFLRIKEHSAPDSRWYRVLWVCQRWSGVGRQSAALWRSIVLMPQTKPDFLEAALQYSGAMSVDVSSYMSNHLVLHVAWMLSRHISRIRRLLIVAPRALGKYESEDWQLNMQKMPLLEDLEVHLCPSAGWGSHSWADNQLLAWSFTADRYPSLRRLSLCGVMTKQPLPVFPMLRRLELNDNVRPAFNIHAFGDYVSSLPQLEELSIKKYRVTGVITHKYYCLPRTLRKFSLEDYGYVVKSWLHAFSFAPTTQVEIIRAIDHDDIEMGRFNCLTVTPCLPKELAPIFPILAQITSVEIRRRESIDFAFVGRTPQGNIITFGGHDHWDTEFADNMCLVRDVAEIFSSSPLVELRVNGTDIHATEQPYWDRIKRHFPNLERLSVERASPNLPHREIRFPLLHELCPPAMRLYPQWKVHLAWPHLKSLALVTGITDGDDEHICKTLVETLQLRAARGCGLAELRLIVSIPKEGAVEGLERRKEIFSDALRQLVDRLTFETQVQENHTPERDIMDVARDYVRAREAEAIPVPYDMW